MEGAPGGRQQRRRIQDQIAHGHSGLLLDDPEDLVSFGAAVQSLLRDRARARRMGEQAHRRVREHYLAPRRLMQEMALVERLTG